jgi:quercetin dioxygenase-like cupin family protein
MEEFPDFMKNPKNRIKQSSQFTKDIDGYVYDGVDGSQMAFWTCYSDQISKEHVHEFDEYTLVVQGTAILYLDGKKHVLKPGDEIFIPKGTKMIFEGKKGTRTIHAFGAKRAERVS